MGLAHPNPGAVFADLRARGIAALLCEGGPRLIARCSRPKVVDELFLTLAPLLTGDEAEPGIVAGGRSGHDGPSSRCAGRSALGDELFLRYGVAYHLSP